MDLAFYGRVSTEDAQDPTTSRQWQLARAQDLVLPLGHHIVTEYFDIGQSRSLPWKRREEASRLLAAVRDPNRGFDGIVIGEPQRAFYGHQFAMTFPVLVHHGVALWVPEVGGRVDPDSEAHDLVMTLFGGMSKGERARIKTRTSASMRSLAATTDRFLGGRPPYGYMLVDAGPHPNPGKAAAGQRAHKLEPDPVTSPIVQAIFEMYANGHGYRAIAERLEAAGAPSPSAHDPARNSHRDPRGWSHGTVRSILQNPAYSGVRVWGKQQKVETLLDVEDVAAGTEVHMRWRDRSEWVTPVAGQTHAPLVDAQLFAQVQARSGVGSPRKHTKPREAAHPYPFRGILFCSVCGKRMQASFHESKRKDGTGRTLYRCDAHRTRALPSSMEHPTSVYVNQATLMPLLDDWIVREFTDPTWLVDALTQDDASAAMMDLKRQEREVGTAITNLMDVIEKGLVSDAIVTQMQQREAERASLRQQIADLGRPKDSMSSAEVRSLIDQLGGLAETLSATPVERKADLYADLGIRIDYDPVEEAYTVLADVGRGCGRVRRGT